MGLKDLLDPPDKVAASRERKAAQSRVPRAASAAEKTFLWTWAIVGGIFLLFNVANGSLLASPTKAIMNIVIVGLPFAIVVALVVWGITKLRRSGA